MNIKSYRNEFSCLISTLQEFTSISNDAIFVDLSQKPLRASCLRITALNANIRDVTDVEVQVNGCGKPENKFHDIFFSF